VQVPRHPNIECASAAAQNVNAIAPPGAHKAIGVLRLSASSQAKNRLRSG
jgi:hypothetical protein